MLKRVGCQNIFFDYTPRTVDEDQVDVKKARCLNHKLEAAVGRAKWK